MIPSPVSVTCSVAVRALGSLPAPEGVQASMGAKQGQVCSPRGQQGLWHRGFHVAVYSAPSVPQPPPAQGLGFSRFPGSRPPHPRPLCSAVPVQEAPDHVQVKNKNETHVPTTLLRRQKSSALEPAALTWKWLCSPRGVFVALAAAPGSWRGPVVVRGPADTRVRALPGSWEHRIWAPPGPGPGPRAPGPPAALQVVAYPAG